MNSDVVLRLLAAGALETELQHWVTDKTNRYIACFNYDHHGDGQMVPT